jgi:hypothetical protein
MQEIDISKMDGNIHLNGNDFYKSINRRTNIWESPFEMSGFAPIGIKKQFTRMPDSIAERISNEVRTLSHCTAGGILRFRTDSRVLVFEAELSSCDDMSHMPRSGSSGFDFYVGNVQHERLYGVTMPAAGSRICKRTLEGLNRRMRDWRINFPLYNGVKEVHIMIEKGASLEKPTSYIVGGPVVFYGSSITQGGCASRPGNAYTHILCRWLGAELLNLGFSGNAKGEPAMAEYIASLRMSAFIMDYDHNAPDLAHLEATHSEFFKIIRHDHPNLPILLVSRPDFDSAPVLNAKRREVIRDTYKR